MANDQRDSGAKNQAGSAESDGAWERFRRAVHAAAESGPMHKTAPKPATKKEHPASKGRVHKGKTRD